ncbi:OmcA/MtrC family decaheme c-type cytochrome [Shewanella avicenniae]|uniref:OmcA/MtrC family decaheme c-type cytochrome n=1 Tax=Shewanella avicenniae TaxID=2814294 RepID=A0ABX7QV55_9GAMM|nr:OmcA/MtrC family decaheme c-type cytochrome [Shewanella avicenniae]QSX34536.1 OmcA/MtrC family decaheme c-type cytochrome [Shewanella avicenniae]
MKKRTGLSLLVLAMTSVLGLSACGDDGKDGVDGANGVNGTNGADGQPGTPGLSAGQFATTIENLTDLVITLEPSDIVVSGTTPFSVKFTAMAKTVSGDMVPFVGLNKIQLYVGHQSENNSGKGSAYQWANHTMLNGAGTSMYCSDTGVTVDAHGNSANACTLVEDPANPGSYTGTWEHEGNAPVVWADDDANSLHRVIIRSYATNAVGVQLKNRLLTAPVDFIPATGELAESAKDTVPDTACIQCHGAVEGFPEGDERINNISRHGANYQSVQMCAMCHTPSTTETWPQMGLPLDFPAMIHAIHTGRENAEFFTSESAVEDFGKISLPMDVADCTMCHTNDEAYNTSITAAACQGCHMSVNFETGEGHSEFNLAQANDSQCIACHGSGELAPINAHKIGDRFATIEALDVSVSNVAYTEGATAADADTLAVTLAVKFKGEAVPAGFDFGTYALSSRVAALMVGTIDQYGMPTAAFTMGLTGAAADATGHVTVTASGNYNLADASIYVASNILLCNDVQGNLASCANAHTNRISVAMPTKYWNLAVADGSNANVGRFSQPERMSANEAGCGNCHDTLVNHHYGNLTFSQCSNCHNNNAPGSAFPGAYVQTGVDADGEPTFGALAITPFGNHDLATVSHRLHSGIQTSATGALIYRDQAGAIVNYPAADTDCGACHVEGKTVFADDGGLTSGRRAIAVTNEDGATVYISPTAEACRSCHAHSDAASYAHFKSNGAVTVEDGSTDKDLPIESCSTCHAEGKTYGVDKVHMTLKH